ncbi:1-aminocyclopropane-1-carboxylate oxidase [Thalictrum thalictroides]|uniref:1-aminocyclopropane-1-carboxylate oxidase n=1 Tax=Thalictrum thalictroides TaxID=46969 RepID=A0A7J6UT20_THATH|nr:1-aminocyclopropane-1-carboxylate oxidase [Thalictrum thalictroides]
MEEMGVTTDNRNTNIVAEMPVSVENVQEMVRKDPSAVPERFIVTNDIDRPNISLVSSGDEIPIIDLSLISDGNEDELKKLDLASSEWGFFQDVAGLQIRHDGGWVSVNPISNALVVNIGDALEIWSNGKYKSIEHRAITNTEKARTSFASFITPNQEIEIGPLDQMIDPVNPGKLYKKMKYGDFVRGSFKEKYEGKGHTKIEKFEV